MIQIEEVTYRHLAGKIVEKLNGSSYLCENIPTDQGELNCVILAYYENEQIPEGEQKILKDIVPVWWNFDACDENSIREETDFSFNELKKYIL